MAYQVIPPASGGGIKSVQRGSAGGAGNVTITAVNIAKSFVTVFGTASSGTTAASFGLNDSNFTLVGVPTSRGDYNKDSFRPPSSTTTSATLVSSNAVTASYGAWTIGRTITTGTVNAGSNNLVAAVTQGFLANSTTLTVSGACRYEVVEFA